MVVPLCHNLQMFLHIFELKVKNKNYILDKSVIWNHPDDYKQVEFESKHNYVCFKNSVFGLVIGSWSSYPYMYIGLLCND